VKVKTSIAVALVVLGVVGISEAYGPKTTHRFITWKAAHVLVEKYPQYKEIISSRNLEALLKGVEEEDEFGVFTRSKNHFLRPTDGSGWYNELLEPGSKGTYANTYQWATGNDSYDWGSCVKSYLSGGYLWAFEGLGHQVHLVQDPTVPAHTKNDTHPPPAGDDVESYCQAHTQSDSTASLITTPIIIPDTKTDFPEMKLRELHYGAALLSYNANRFQATQPSDFNGRWEGELARMFDIRAIKVGPAYKWVITGIGSLGEEWWECQGDPGYYYIENTDIRTPIPNGWDKHLCEEFAEELIPAAISYTVAVLKLFFETVEKELVPKITLSVLYSDSIASDTRAIDHNIRPTIKVEWENFSTHKDFIEVLWRNNRAEYSSLGFTFEPNSAIFYSRYSMYRDGTLQVRSTDNKKRMGQGEYVYSPIINIKVVPHPTLYHVSKNGSDDTRNGPFLTIQKALDRIRQYHEDALKGAKPIVDTVLVERGVYNESPIIRAPTNLICSDTLYCTIGNKDHVIVVYGDGSNDMGSLENFRINQEIHLQAKGFEIRNNYITQENWNEEDADLSDRYWAVFLRYHSYNIKIIRNTFDVTRVLGVIDSDVFVYSNLVTERCLELADIYREDYSVVLGGRRDYANSFLGGEIKIYGQFLSATYNWWGTPDIEELKWLVRNKRIDNRFHLTSPPSDVGAKLPLEKQGDFDLDGQVGFTDFTRLISHFGNKEEDEKWDSRYDLDANGTINLSDFLALVAAFGK